MIKKPSILIFLIVPLLTIAYVAAAMHEMVYFYYGWFDPVYAYLMNGLTFASGSIEIGHTDHPGTPLQLFAGFIIFVMGLFMGNGDLITDVIAHPEFYSHAISYALILINVVTLYFLGFKSFKATNSLAIALIIQVVPFFSFDAIHFIPIVATESVLVFSVLTLTIVVISNCRSAKTDKLIFTVLIAFLSGLIISTKISALPVLALPFFFLKGTKRKIQYSLFALLFTFLFILPVLPKLKSFILFIEAIFTHTGAYGSGEEKIIDWSVYYSAIRSMLTSDIPFTLHLLLLIAGWITVAIKRNVEPELKRIWLGLTTATIIAILIVARQYSFHYLLPVYIMAMPIQVFFWFSIFQNRINGANFDRYTWIVWLLVMLIFIRLVVRFHFYPKLKNPVSQTVAEINKHYNGTYIIVGQSSRGGAFHEPALRFGLAYTGRRVSEIYRKKMAEFYPNNYYWNRNDGLSNWHGSIMAAELFSQHDSLYFYNRSASCDVGYREIVEMLTDNGLDAYVKTRIVFENIVSNEVVVLAITDTRAVRKMLMPSAIVLNDMEKCSMDGEYFLSVDGTSCFEGGKLQTNLAALEGEYSMLLTSTHPYGLKTDFHVQSGNHFRLEAWQKSSGTSEALIVASANDDGRFYKTSKPTNDKIGEWKRYELILNIPDNFSDSIISFYLWMPKGDSVWIDNFKIEHFFN